LRRARTGVTDPDPTMQRVVVEHHDAHSQTRKHSIKISSDITRFAGEWTLHWKTRY
jgi:hypothetical protein